MIFNDRLEYYDQCIAGEKTQYIKLVSKEVFNTFDRGYDLYRDYIKQKSTISNVDCSVEDGEIILHFESKKTIEELVSDNLPKKGITPTATEKGVDLHIKIMDIINV